MWRLVLLLDVQLPVGQGLSWRNEDVDIVGLAALLLLIQALKALRDESPDV